MSEFLLVAPSGWTEIGLDNLASKGITAESLASQIATINFQAVTEMLVSAEAIPTESVVLDAKMFDNTFFIVKLA